MCSTHGLVHWTKFEPKQNAIGWFTGKKGQKMWIFHILAIFFHFHTKSCRTFEGLTHHSVGLQKWSSYWQKLQTICKKLTILEYKCNQVIYGPKMTKNWILSILAIFYYFHTKSCLTFEGLTHHPVCPQKWSTY